MPLQETSGNSTQDAYGVGAAVVTNYIEDVFSTWLYTGNSANQTIVNGIDLAGKGGLVWVKNRQDTTYHNLFDTNRGIYKRLFSNTTSAQTTTAGYLDSFNSNGFDTGVGLSDTFNYVSWTFRKQPKFFDVVTYTGDGQNDRQVAHNLGSTPGCIIVKSLYNTGSGGPSNWLVYHQSIGITKNLYLNTTAAAFTGYGEFGTPTSTYFVVNQPGGGDSLNLNGDQYVAYLFAHNAGGFGLTGTDNVISCGSFTADGSGNANVTLGYEPQWVLIKCTTSGQGWYLTDTMRGMPVSPATTTPYLIPNTSSAENAWGSVYGVNATGFNTTGLLNSATYIYIAIRRGPMKVPTDATKVFLPSAVSTDATAITTNFPVDMLFDNQRAGNASNTVTASRLIGSPGLITSSTAAEAAGLVISTCFQSNVNYKPDALGSNVVCYAFQRAPGFFDEVCYTGTGANTTFTHNLAVVPELMIVKSRSAAGNQWAVYAAPLGNTDVIYLNKTDATSSNAFVWNNTTPTSSVFTVSIAGAVNSAGATYVAYLFATCAGVSKVGSYTGNGTTQAIACGFTGGARFVLIKRTDSTGNWYVYDTARGMTTLTDPYLFLNTTAAETATLGSVTTTTGGFTVNATILAAINTSSATYIFLAIA
jgi:hypothetical protein